jgi:hypothetical protein
MFDPNTMRDRFRVLGEQKASIEEKLAPLQAKRDALRQEYEAQTQPIEDQIKEISSPMFVIDQERAIIARALAGKTG